MFIQSQGALLKGSRERDVNQLSGSFPSESNTATSHGVLLETFSECVFVDVCMYDPGFNLKVANFRM